MVNGLADMLDFAGASAGVVVPRVATGARDRVARLKAIGNGQVPLVAATAWTILMNHLDATSKGLAATHSARSLNLEVVDEEVVSADSQGLGMAVSARHPY